MTEVYFIEESQEQSLWQRWSHYLTLFIAFVAFLHGLNLRNGILNATQIYSDTQAGIRAEYPLNWLIDFNGDYIFRVRDMTFLGFKTTIQVTTRAITTDTTERNIEDALTLRRAQNLSNYILLSTGQIELPNQAIGRSIQYTFVQSSINPLLEEIPIIIRGFDVIVVESNQAIIITFQADTDAFEQEVTVFEKFLDSIRF